MLSAIKCAQFEIGCHFSMHFLRISLLLLLFTGFSFAFEEEDYSKSEVDAISKQKKDNPSTEPPFYKNIRVFPNNKKEKKEQDLHKARTKEELTDLEILKSTPHSKLRSFKKEKEKYSRLEIAYQKLFKQEAFQFIEEPEKPLKQIGYNIFSEKLSKNDLSSRDFSSDFELVEGDELYIAVYGSANWEKISNIDANQNLFIPKIGAISLSGLKFKEANKKITKRIQDYYIDSKVYLRLVSKADRSIYVIGKVKQPGLKSMTSSSLYKAILKSGGILKNGSLRHLEIRKQKKLQKIDLYNLIMLGQWESSILTGGEKVFIPPIRHTVALFGEILEPGIYELGEKSSLSELLEKIQSLTPFSLTHKVNIYRLSKINNNVDTITIDEKNYDKTKLEPFDLVQVLPRQHLIGNSFSIQGAVEYPGNYEIREKESLLTAIEQAGGITQYHGKTILLLRKLKANQHLNLPNQQKGEVKQEAFEFNMDTSDLKQIPILSGDQINIPKIDPTIAPALVTIYGEVKRPGSYTYKNRLNILHLLNLAGGSTPLANLENLTVARPSQDKRVLHIKLPSGKSIESRLQKLSLIPGDVITIPKQANHHILAKASGEFHNPGTYLLIKGARLSDLIDAAGGLRESAFVKGAAFFRKSEAIAQNKQLLKSADKLERDLLRAQSKSVENALQSQNDKNTTIFSLQERLVKKLRTSKSTGRIAIQLPEQIKKLVGSTENIILEDGDKVNIPSQPSTIHIIGQVNNPNTIVYAKNYTLIDYLNFAGGLTPHADEDNIYIYRANGRVVPSKNLSAPKRSWLTGRYANDYETSIEPGDTILVPEDFEIKPNKLQLTKDITQIIFQIITSVGVAAAAF